MTNLNTKNPVTWCLGCDSKIYKLMNINNYNMLPGDSQESPDDSFLNKLFLQI